MAWPEHVEEEMESRRLERANKVKFNLPSSVFASEVEEEVGMLNKAAPVSGPQLHLDSDLVAAMDEDFDYDDPDNMLEDNFIELAQGVAPSEEMNEEDEDNYIDSDFDGTEDEEHTFEKEETKSRFTNYSVTSSVIRRNDQLRLLDDRFEKMFEEYDENEIGALDTEEIEGYVPENSDILLQYAEEFERDQKKEFLDKEKMTEKVMECVELLNDEEEFEYVQVKEKPKWDCETILSTYSNLYNHPKLIKEPPKKSNKIKIDKRTGIPKDVIDSNKLTAKALNRLDQENTGYQPKGPKSVAGKFSTSNTLTLFDWNRNLGQSVISQLSALSIRNKNETPEEKRDRKMALKEYRRERRLEKKQNSEAFKDEAKRQVKISINNRNNVQGNRIL